jgi:hypothetical protein
MLEHKCDEMGMSHGINQDWLMGASITGRELLVGDKCLE